jgi:hypothetical protein
VKRLLALAILVALAGGCVLPEERLVVTERPVAGGLDVTFFVMGDSHFGFPGMEAANRRIVEQMNALPGAPYPAALGGTVARPAGVLHTGDITDGGAAEAWRDFVKMYGLTGKEGLLKYPIFECTGNHDRVNLFSSAVADGVRERHGGLPYAWDWGDLHVICLDELPTPANLRWLRRDLATVGHSVPVVLYFHRCFEGFLKDDWPFWWKEAFARALEGYNVAAIFNGHWHVAGHQAWKGYDVFRSGSPHFEWHTFLVVHITDEKMTVALWNWDLPDATPPAERWVGPFFVKSLRRPAALTPPL